MVTITNIIKVFIQLDRTIDTLKRILLKIEQGRIYSIP